jgi:PKHD-type hydroxylase
MSKVNLTNWQLHTTSTEDWAWYTDVFSDQELDAIIALCEGGDIAPGTTFKGQTESAVKSTDANSAIRRSNIAWITPADPNAEWLFRRVTDIVLAANEKYFKFDLTEIEHLQYTIYHKGDHYDWHKDMLPQTPGHAIRKLSFSLLLDDPQDYKGGDLELMLGKDVTTPERQRGKIIFFPGYVLHRVTPVTKGVRHSLVGWVKGPGWR